MFTAFVEGDEDARHALLTRARTVANVLRAGVGQRFAVVDGTLRLLRKGERAHGNVSRVSAATLDQVARNAIGHLVLLRLLNAWKQRSSDASVEQTVHELVASALPLVDLAPLLNKWIEEEGPAATAAAGIPSSRRTDAAREAVSTLVLNMPSARRFDAVSGSFAMFLRGALRVHVRAARSRSLHDTIASSLAVPLRTWQAMRKAGDIPKNATAEEIQAAAEVRDRRQRHRPEGHYTYAEMTAKTGATKAMLKDWEKRGVLVLERDERGQRRLDAAALFAIQRVVGQMGLRRRR